MFRWKLGFLLDSKRIQHTLLHALLNKLAYDRSGIPLHVSVDVVQ